MDRGERAITIDEVPLDWCFQPGVKLDFRHFADGYVATAADVEAELDRIGHALTPLEIVVVNTRAGAATARPITWTPAAAWATKRRMYLTERGVRRHRHRRLELGRAVPLHRPEIRRDRRRRR